jgi:hypothetical protein
VVIQMKTGAALLLIGNRGSVSSKGHLPTICANPMPDAPVWTRLLESRMQELLVTSKSTIESLIKLELVVLRDRKTVEQLLDLTWLRQLALYGKKRKEISD